MSGASARAAAPEPRSGHDLGTTRALDRAQIRLRHVELIAALYECRSILKASRRLNLTQPTLTKALRTVERRSDLRLFERTNRGLEPTPYGESSRGTQDRARAAAHAARSWRTCASAIAARSRWARCSPLPPASCRCDARLKMERPGVTISVAVGTYDFWLPSLLVGISTWCSGACPRRAAAARCLRGFLLRADLACHAAGHPLLRKRRLGLRDLVNEAWLLAIAGDRAAA